MGKLSFWDCSLAFHPAICIATLTHCHHWSCSSFLPLYWSNWCCEQCMKLRMAPMCAEIQLVHHNNNCRWLNGANESQLWWEWMDALFLEWKGKNWWLPSGKCVIDVWLMCVNWNSWFLKCTSKWECPNQGHKESDWFSMVLVFIFYSVINEIGDQRPHWKGDWWEVRWNEQGKMRTESVQWKKTDESRMNLAIWFHSLIHWLMDISDDSQVSLSVNWVKLVCMNAFWIMIDTIPCGTTFWMSEFGSQSSWGSEPVMWQVEK